MKRYLTEWKKQVAEFKAAEMTWRDGYEHTEQGPVMSGKEHMLQGKG